MGQSAFNPTVIGGGNISAWVNYDGVTNVIRDSFNVTSVTDNSSGNFTVNFTVAMPDINYALSGSAQYGQGGQSSQLMCGPGGQTTYALTTTTARITTVDENHSQLDALLACVAFFS